MPNQSQNAQYSSEIQDIIGQVPSWIIRWGLGAISLVIIIFFICSYFIKYPDTIFAEVDIMSIHQPFEVSLFKDGPQEHVYFVKQGDKVNIGDTLLLEKNLLTGAVTPAISAVEGLVNLQHGSDENPLKSIIFVNPEIDQLKAYLYLPHGSYGKVRTGQRVLIELSSYPREDFGMLEGEIIHINHTAYKKKYQVEVRLEKGLTTIENYTIPESYHLEGVAEIVLEDKSILARMIGNSF